MWGRRKRVTSPSKQLTLAELSEQGREWVAPQSGSDLRKGDTMASIVCHKPKSHPVRSLSSLPHNVVKVRALADGYVWVSEAKTGLGTPGGSRCQSEKGGLYTEDRKAASQTDVVGTRKGCGPGSLHSPTRSPSAARPLLPSAGEHQVSTRQPPAWA